MMPKFLFVGFFYFLCLISITFGGDIVKNLNSNSSLFAGIEIPEHSSFNAVSSSSDCNLSTSKKLKVSSNEDDVFVEMPEPKQNPKPSVKLHLKHRSAGKKSIGRKKSLLDSTTRDQNRIQTLHTRIRDKKNQNTISRLKTTQSQSPVQNQQQQQELQLMGTLKSGVSDGSGEYFMDVFVGTPPKHFSLILDTGSDLNWIQCVPCYDCFEQIGPHYNPKDSTSFQNVTCHDPRCALVSSPDPPQPCKSESQTCPYFYWYGDSSNTTGDFAMESFTVNLTAPNGNGKNGSSEYRLQVENVMFGCGHWNRGLFHGAAGLLGLGRGPLSFSSQLQSLYGHSFSYCLVDRNSNSSVSSKLILGEDKDLLSHPELNFTSLVSPAKENENSMDTFYYVKIKSVTVGGEVLKIPQESWDFSPEGAGGTIIDSGTTLSYFADPAYEIIKQTFISKVKKFPLVRDFPILEPCYNVSGSSNYELELPTFGILFGDGAVWNFPVDNYFIKVEPEEVVCLAILGTPRSAMSIIGNYQQQNFHIMYDTMKSRLGFAPTRCSDV